jgi:hypothetical protein
MSGRQITLATWVIALALLPLIALRIVSYGLVPAGDARRHVAMAFTDKTYPELLVLRPEYTLNHSPGWESLLKWVRRTADWDKDTLASFSIAALLLCVLLAPLPWLRRPEAWLLALLAELIALPDLMTRWTQGRPYLFTEGVLIAVLFAWSKPNRPGWRKLALTWIGISLSVWIHGAWYLWVLPLAAFFVAGWWRLGLALTGCWAAGSLTGALLTGKPLAFLKQAVWIVTTIQSEHAPSWMLVGEFRPSTGEFTTLLLLGLVLLWRRSLGTLATRSLATPAFCLIAISWILGFKADRFWADWGIPGTLVWLTLELEEVLESFWPAGSGKRVLACAVASLPLFLQATNDLDRRYSYNLQETFVDAHDPDLKDWLPGPHGIFFTARMDFFYNTFYANPEADWRYTIGFEPALMPANDLKVLRQIQWNPGSAKAYQPWIDKMQSADRLVVASVGSPDLPRLEWHRTAAGLWIGRLPTRSGLSASTAATPGG